MSQSPEPAPRIGPGRTVALHLEVRFHDGFVALSTFGTEPIACRIGDGTLTPGLESALAGLPAGADETLLASGSELFADYDPDNLHWLDRQEFPPELDLQPGQLVAFETPGAHETSGLILDLDGDRVHLDFNHPFAGRSLTLRVQVLSVT
jgi:FKBP-type peptidyl-prolyl cis-trans isomerase 2